jgi:hypothetical protein
MVLVAGEQLTRILLCFQPANSLFASKESSGESSKVQEVDIQQRLHIHILGIGGNIRLAALGQPYPFSATQA